MNKRFDWLELFLRPLSWWVPRKERESWRRQWRADLLDHAQRGEGQGGLKSHAAGAAADAFWMRLDALREGIFFDLRLAWRGLMRRKSRSILMVLVLAVGLGGSVLIAALIDSILLAPLPHPDPDRLVRLWERHAEAPAELAPTAKGNLLDFRQASAFEALAGYYVTPRTVEAAEEAEVVAVAQVSEDFFTVLGNKPMIGRTFTAEETARSVFNPANSHRGEDPVIVLGHEFWRSRFHGDRSIVGRSFELESKRWTVIGVMPADFSYPSSQVAAWIPWSFEGPKPRDQRFIHAIGRVASNQSLSQASQEVEAVAAELSGRFPETNEGWSVTLQPLFDAEVGHLGPTLWVAFGAAFCVWLLATVNVAVLQWVRSRSRHHELNVRRALGASRLRLSRLILIDAALPVLIGAVLGCALATGLLGWLKQSTLLDIPRLAEAALGPKTFVFAAVIALLTSFLTGLGPAFSSAELRRGRASMAIRGHGSGSQNVRAALVVTEVALAMLLLTTAGLFARSLLELYRVDPGFKAEGVVVAPVILDNYRYGGAESWAYYERLRGHLESIPGVLSTGASTVLPMSDIGPDFDRPVWAEGEQAPVGGHRAADMRMATPGLFKTLGIELQEGRDFDGRDRFDSPPVTIINRSLADEVWPNLDPIGRRLMVDLGNRKVPYEVVGLIADLRRHSLIEPPRREFYVPHAQRPYLIMNLAIRVDGYEATFLPRIRSAILELDPSQPAHSVTALADLVDASISKERATALLVTLLSAVALLLATLGVYGALALWVSQRSRELGIRMALGADGAQISSRVLSKAAWLVGAGLTVGALLALGTGRLIEGLLHGVDGLDPAAYLLGFATLFVAGVLAAWPPLRRALATDPAHCLREE